MRKVILYIAMSLDGFIASKDGKVNWLHGQNDDEENIDTYSSFIKDVDTVIMGWNTYYQVKNELSPDNWVYDSLTSYIITHRKLDSTNNINFVQKNSSELVKDLKQKNDKSIWICGGAKIIQPLIQDNLIDEYYISVIPTILGDGIKLFEPVSNELKLKLKSTQSYNGITELIYTRR
ncbi:dihydrofolate reductase family protein [Thomasclavelia spiroformis]|jgi:dihydrofolate reductase|uniref:dihydrofolate reductase family protein n=1 Tax=Thomasclavelia spiroformis TaxID=29348 RepID=UPI00265EA835|nr:dihydrofolate reductase family protein [Thomasclavelia spiroformis]